MRFSYNFVKKYLDLALTPQELAAKLINVGFEVASIEKTGSDVAIEIELTSDRPDMLSILGVTNELAAILEKEPKISLSPAAEHTTTRGDMSVTIEDTKDCPFYSATVIKGVMVKESPDWMKDLLLANGVDPINNIVDITNYCMIKWGEPMHAFDADTIEGGIRIRRAEEKEIIECLDAKTRELTRENLVIADSKKPVALAGIIGGEKTKILDETKDIILECALFDPVVVRHTRKQLGINTDSSYRFERFVYPQYVCCALNQARDLILELAGGKIEQEVYSGKLEPLAPSHISLNIEALNEYLGVRIEKDQIVKILTLLNCEIEDQGKELTVKTPAYRQDLKIEQDLYEEVLRIWGIEKVPAVLPLLERRVVEETEYDFKKHLSQHAVSLGFSEAITMNITDQANILLDPEKQPVVIANPLKAHENRMRTEIFSGLINSLVHNVKQKQVNVRFFESAHVFEMDEEKAREEEHICFVENSSREESFYEFKARIEKFLQRCTGSAEFISLKKEHFSSAKEVVCTDKKTGFIGVLSAQRTRELDLHNVFVAEFDINMLKKARKEPEYRKIINYPSVLRDISLAVKQSIEYSIIHKHIVNAAGELFAGVEVIDIYKGNKIEKGTVAYTLRISYQHTARTLEAEEVDKLHFGLRESLGKIDGVIVR